MKPVRIRTALPLIALALVALTLAAGCSSGSPVAAPVASQNTAPPAADLSAPQQAVESYLTWISYAYRIGESDVASHTMSADEGVRVDSYLQYNKEQGRGIAQRLVSFRPGEASVEGTHAVLSAREKWEYRYVYVGERTTTPVEIASYDTTYTVIEIRPDTWVVDSVEAKPLTQIK